MAGSFNLVDEPWIPCINLEGNRVELGIRSVLADAHTLREIRDDSPLVTLTLHRLLLAVLHRVFGPTSKEDWGNVWTSGRFAAADLNSYLDQHRQRFNLVDKTHPFFQDPSLKADSPSAITRLALVQGNNATLFDHRTEHEPARLTPAEAARLLVAYQAFAVGGGVSNPFNFMHGPLVRDKGFLSLVTGDNLFETLWLNCMVFNQHAPVPGTGNDVPVWERPGHRTPIQSGTPIDGYLDYLTFLSRRILLLPDGGDKLRFSSMVMLQGLTLLQDTALREPMGLYRKQTDGSLRAASLEPGRALWRDSHALLAGSGGSVHPPATLIHLAACKNYGYLDENRHFSMSIIGLSSDRAKISFWRHETLPLPIKYIGNERLIARLAIAIHTAELGAEALSRACRALAIAICQMQDGKADKDRVSAIMENLSADTRYWPTLEHPFRRLVVDLPLHDDDEAHHRLLAQWRQIVRDSAKSVFNQVVNGLDASPRSFRAAYGDNGSTWSASRTLMYHLHKLKTPDTEEAEHDPDAIK